LANLVKGKINQALSGSEGAAIHKVGSLRAKLKERAPGVGGAVGKRRMAWMTRLCNGWTMEELAMLNEQSMRRLLDEGWENDEVPSPRALGLWAGRKRPSLTPLLHNLIGFSAGVAFAVALNGWLRRR
jgi:precorrin-2 dehydrogenase/sirohydrochlorin ferrochelatase